MDLQYYKGQAHSRNQSKYNNNNLEDFFLRINMTIITIIIVIDLG